MNEKIKLLAIVPNIYDTSPGQRFRLEQWESLLKEKGVEVTYFPFETEDLRRILYKIGKTPQKIKAVIKNMKRRREEMKELTDFDLIYVFREAALLGPPWFERKIADSGVPMIFDFDDAVFITYKSLSNGYLSYLKFAGKTSEICKLSAHVMAGNQYLADYAKRTNQNVTIIPTTIDTEKYQVVEKDSENDLITIGWSGSFSTVPHLDTIREVFQELVKEKKFRLKVIGTDTYEIPGVNMEAMAWKSESEVEDLACIDIGVMPLPDDEWSKGKCGLKALQYMALGIPTICSPVGVNATIIEDGVNGFLASGKDEWIEKIKQLMNSVELRRKFGQAGRKTVEEKYSAKVVAPQVLELFGSIVKKDKYHTVEAKT